jgi:hypothetical protein
MAFAAVVVRVPIKYLCWRGKPICSSKPAAIQAASRERSIRNWVVSAILNLECCGREWLTPQLEKDLWPIILEGLVR